jgi:hypothetical protein
VPRLQAGDFVAFAGADAHQTSTVSAGTSSDRTRAGLLDVITRLSAEDRDQPVT